MTGRSPVGDEIVAFLERAGVRHAFGVISIHNMPILDALGRRNAIRFVPSRGEAGAVNMADACTRVGGVPAVAVTSTGTGAGNAAGALVEAATAGTPLIHLTGQIESAHLDRGWGSIHEAPDQLGMLRSVSKRAFRIAAPGEALGVLREAWTTATTPPTGPVSIEIPIDVQHAVIDGGDGSAPGSPVRTPPDDGALEALVERLERSRRPMLWIGGGCRGAEDAVARLADAGFGVVTSTNGRGILPEDHPASLGAFTQSPPVEALYRSCDALVVAGSRLRGNETLRYSLALPRPMIRVDVDPARETHAYPTDLFVRADALVTLGALAERLAGRLSVDDDFAAAVREARRAAEAALRATLGPYGALVDGLARALGEAFVWVRDVTISNSTWGNRLLRVHGPRDGVHALGGGIGQSVPMAVGAAMAAGGRPVACLVGDGGLQLSLGELATAVETGARVVVLVMNSRSYAVIKNIQDARYGGRHYFADLLTPSLAGIAGAVGMPHLRLDDVGATAAVVGEALAHVGPVMIEVDMEAIGEFAEPFAGPPARKR